MQMIQTDMPLQKWENTEISHKKPGEFQAKPGDLLGDF